MAHGHDVHFLERLERLSTPETELALSLYQDPLLIRALLEQIRLPEGAARVAPSLGDGARGPFVVVARDGHFVTCLAEGGKLPRACVYRAGGSHMPAQIRFRFQETRRLLGSAVLLISIASVVAGCDAPSAAAASQRFAITDSSVTQSFVARARQRLLFIARPSASPADVEAYYKSSILPVVARDRRIGEITAYFDGKTDEYIVDLELRIPAAADRSLAIDVLSVGRTFDDGERVLDGFARYFDVASARQLTRRDDLSISRSIIGAVEGGTP